MSKYCSDCTYLNPNKSKKEGMKGCYKCSKTSKFVLANQPSCDKFCLAYARKNYEREKLYDEGKELSNKSSSNASPGALLILLIVLIIIKILVG
ncbi:MAG: hypothetical protein RR325_01215 [Bacilli bacterium]